MKKIFRSLFYNFFATIGAMVLGGAFLYFLGSITILLFNQLVFGYVTLFLVILLVALICLVLVNHYEQRKKENKKKIS